MLSNGSVEKTVLQQKKICWVGLCSKFVGAVGFSEEPIFLSVSFHHEMFNVTSFRLVLGVYIVIFDDLYVINY